MYDEGIRQQIETMPNNFRVVSRWRIMRIVDQFEPVHAAITDDGSGTEAGVNERVACEGRTVAPMRSKGSRTTPCVIRLEGLLDRPDAGPSLLDARPGELSGLRSGCPADASVDPSPATGAAPPPAPRHAIARQDSCETRGMGDRRFGLMEFHRSETRRTGDHRFGRMGSHGSGRLGHGDAERGDGGQCEGELTIEHDVSPSDCNASHLASACLLRRKVETFGGFAAFTAALQLRYMAARARLTVEASCGDSAS